MKVVSAFPLQDIYQEAESTRNIKTMLSFGQHAREIITSEVGLAFLQLIGDSTALQKLFNNSVHGKRILSILRHTQIKIIVLENENGRELVEQGQLCNRFNGNGVDLNRNYDVDFGKRDADFSISEENPGPYPRSEPEAQIVSELAQEFSPMVYVNVHSGMYALFMPYDYKAGIPSTGEALKQFQMLQILNKVSCSNICTVGNGGGSDKVGYFAHGTSTDYMYEKQKVPLSFTFEIFEDSKDFDDCICMFNPHNTTGFVNSVAQWVSTILSLINLIPEHPQAQPFIEKWADVTYLQEAKYNFPQQDESQQALDKFQASDNATHERLRRISQFKKQSYLSKNLDKARSPLDLNTTHLRSNDIDFQSKIIPKIQEQLVQCFALLDTMLVRLSIGDHVGVENGTSNSSYSLSQKSDYSNTTLHFVQDKTQEVLYHYKQINANSASKFMLELPIVLLVIGLLILTFIITNKKTPRIVIKRKQSQQRNDPQPFQKIL